MKTGWLVFESHESGPKVHYNGPDKAKAREKAAKLLSDGKAEVCVTRIRDVVRLKADSMESVLPSDSF